jgi:CubicO group peptidase (beta-lactamase class C family)
MIARLATLLFLLTAPGFTQDPARLDQIVQSYVKSNQFMGTVLVAKGDQVLLSKGYGSANLEWNIPNAPSTKFRLGSMTKQFTAAGILLLEERGKLKVEDPVKKYMPDAPAAWDKITIFHVLTHTAGIPNFTGFADYATTEALPSPAEKTVLRFRDKPLDFEPGSKFSYSNSGYVLLGYLIEKISGESYEKFLQENIFTPLEMKDSGYDSNSAVIPRRAAGYSLAAPGSNTLINAGFVNMSIPGGAGALYSTIEDLLKWERALFGGKVLSAASLQKMTTPFKDDYAFGVLVRTESGRKQIWHNGGIEGFNTAMAYYPDSKVVVAVLANVNGPTPDQMLPKLAAVAHGEAVQLTTERKEITVPSDLLAKYVGVYGMAPGVNMTIMLTNGQLISQMTGQGQVPLFAESENLFFPKVVDAQIEFPKDVGAGPAGQLTLHQNGRDITAKRLDDAEAKKVMDAALAFDKRFKDQTAAPGSEAALRRMIGELQTGKPNYDLMSTGLANATRQQLPQLQPMITGLGALQSLSFKGVGPGGADIYLVTFEKGALEYRIWLGADGKTESANVRPAQ